MVMLSLKLRVSSETNWSITMGDTETCSEAGAFNFMRLAANGPEDKDAAESLPLCNAEVVAEQQLLF